MKYQLSDTQVLWKKMKVKVKTPVFTHLASGFITAYEDEGDNLIKTAQDVGNALDSGPDGALLWLPLGLKESFETLATDFWKQAFEDDKLNFDNGGVAETLFFHDFEQGTLVEMIDPECFSEVFSEILETFLKKEKKKLGKSLKSIYYHEDCHLDSNWEREMDNKELKALLKPYGKYE